MKITIGTPHRFQWVPEYVGRLPFLMIHTAKQFGEVDFEIAQAECTYLSETRNEIFQSARNNQSDYLCLIDADSVFQVQSLTQLIKLNKDVSTLVYVNRKYPYKPTVYTFTETGHVRSVIDIPKVPWQVDCAGCGFMLISRKVLDYFDNKRIAGVGGPFSHIQLTKSEDLKEDVSFCHRLKNAGFELWADPTIEMGHQGMTTFHVKHFEEVKKQLGYGSKIEGWMNPTELLWLRETARGMKSVVEIGCWKGRSTEALLMACQGPVYAVDDFSGEGAETTQKMVNEENIFEQFMQNVGHFKNLKIIKKKSLEASEEFNGNRVDMTFIDGNHDYDHVKADIETWLPKTNKLICGHDYGWPGVKEAVTECLGNVKVIESIWWKEI